jgi:hypothetical protein
MEDRIASIKSYFLQDDAISLNGRKYPKETVDRLLLHAQEQLADPNALPLTCYLSHDDAWLDATRNIVGKIVGIGRERDWLYAMIDVPDTQAGHDAAELTKGGYIRSQSLRAINAEMFIDKNEPLPLVGGQNICLTGIDFTSSPGIPNARVEYVSESSESKEPQNIREIFHTSKDTLLIEEFTRQESKDIPASPKEKEQSMTPEEKAQLLKEFRESLLAEQQQQKEAEKHPPQGGDATIPVQTKPTAEDALKVLQEAGYTVAAPKTQEEIMQEKADQMLAKMREEFDQKLAEEMKKFQPRFPAQRKSMVEGSNAEEKPAKKPYYRNGDYLKEQMRDVNVRLDLLDRSKPRPEWYNAERMLKELEVELMGIMDAQHSFDNSLQMGEV